METIPAACRRKLTAWHRFQLLMFFQLVAVLDVRDHLGPRGVSPQACLEHTIPARQHGFPRKISHQLEQKDSPKLVTAAAEQSDSGKRVGPAAPTPPTTLSRERLIWAANRGSETRKPPPHAPLPEWHIYTINKQTQTEFISHTYEELWSPLKHVLFFFSHAFLLQAVSSAGGRSADMPDTTCFQNPAAQLASASMFFLFPVSSLFERHASYFDLHQR